MIILASESTYNFASYLMLTCFTLLFFRGAKVTFSHVTAVFVNMPFNKEYSILITLHDS